MQQEIVLAPSVITQCRSTLLRYTYTVPVCNCMHQHLCTLKSQTLTATLFLNLGHTKLLHTLRGMGSAALAAAVSYLVMAPRISLKGQRSSKNRILYVCRIVDHTGVSQVTLIRKLLGAAVNKLWVQCLFRVLHV